MPIIAKDSGGNFTPHPAGTHQAVCVDVVDEGMQPGFNGKDTHKISIIWQTEELNPDTKSLFTIRKWYTLSLNEKSTLSAHLEAWFGKSFTPEQRAGGFDVENIIGHNCQLTITHEPKDNGQVRAVVKSISGLGKGMTPIQAHGYTRVKDRAAA